MKLLILTFALVSAASLYAQPPGAPQPQAGPDGPPSGPESPRGPRGPRPNFQGPLMAALDTNKDGELSPEEIANASASLKTLDKDGDGKVGKEELRPPLPPLPPRDPKGPGAPGGPGNEGDGRPPRPGRDTDKGVRHEGPRGGGDARLSWSRGGRPGPDRDRAFPGVMAGGPSSDFRGHRPEGGFRDFQPPFPGDGGPREFRDGGQREFRSPDKDGRDGRDGRDGFRGPRGEADGLRHHGLGMFRGPRPEGAALPPPPAAPGAGAPVPELAPPPAPAPVQESKAPESPAPAPAPEAPSAQ